MNTLSKLAKISFNCIFFISILSGCVSNKTPENVSVIAPSSIIQLKEKYSASISNDTSSIDEKNTPLSSLNQNKRPRGSYILGAGDALTVVINHLPTPAYDIIIRPDGFISLPIVDDVKASGLTPSQLDDKLTSYFSKRIVNPEISVMVRSARQPMVYVLGDVRNPTSIPFTDATSAAEAIARAGDMLPTAFENGITIIRLDKDGLLKPISINANIKIKNGSEDYQVSPYIALAATRLEPEDILFIPEKGSSQLGSQLEQLFRPVIATGSAFSSVLSPVLLYKTIKSLDAANDAVSVGVQ